MVRVGLCGHMDLTSEAERVVYAALLEHLAQLAPRPHELVGVSCLARGADTLGAKAVLELGGSLEVVLPSRDYRQAKVKPDHAPQFDALLSQATTVHTMDFDHAGRTAYEAANSRLLELSDMLVAVWDGKPSGGKGGTADAVADARTRGLPITVIWPDGAARKSDAPARIQP